MELIECKTCGAHSFTNDKCDFCGNVYKIEEEEKETMIIIDDYHDYLTTDEEPELEEFKENKFIHENYKLKPLGYLVAVLSVVWFVALLFATPFTIIVTLFFIGYMTHRKKKNK